MNATTPTSSFSLDDKRVTHGWFSRKHKTFQPHIEAQQEREYREQDAAALALQSRNERASRSNAQQE